MVFVIIYFTVIADKNERTPETNGKSGSTDLTLKNGSSSNGVQKHKNRMRHPNNPPKMT